MRRIRQHGVRRRGARAGLGGMALWVLACAMAFAQPPQPSGVSPPGRSSATDTTSAPEHWAVRGPGTPPLTAPAAKPTAEAKLPASETVPAEAFAQPPPLVFPWAQMPGSAPSTAPLMDDAWGWQWLPQGGIYRAYLAGVRESRFASAWNYERRWGGMWDIALGGHTGMLRYGNYDPFRPEGFQVDIEGAAFPRLDLERDLDLVATDFRFGIPLTYGRGRYQTKLAYYHLSSHLGDEFMLRSGGWTRINYTRNALVWGHSYYLTGDLRLYAEAAWSFDTDGGAEPWEFQFGVDYSPAEPAGGLRGSPFLALNAHLRQEVDFGGNFVVQTGWQWRGATGGLFRMGMQYFAGKSEQYEFFSQYENKIGLGLWYDF